MAALIEEAPRTTRNKGIIKKEKKSLILPNFNEDQTCLRTLQSTTPLLYKSIKIIASKLHSVRGGRLDSCVPTRQGHFYS